MSDKLRDAMIDQDGAVWEKIGGAWSLYKPAQSAAVPEHIRAIKIPTDAMEQEFQKHYRRGYEAGKGDAQTVPVVGEVDKMAESISGMVMEWVTAASAHNGDWQSGLARIIRKRIERFQPTTSITPAELARLQKSDARLEKLLGYMSSNVSEGWLEVSRIASVATYMGWEEAENYLDGLPRCNVGLMEIDAAIAGEKK